MSKITSFTYDPKEKTVNIGTDDVDDITFDCLEIPVLLEKMQDAFRHYQQGLIFKKLKELMKQYEQN